MYAHHAVVHFAQVAVPLPPHAHRVVAALGDPGLVHHANSLGMRMILGNDPLAAVVEFFFIPLARFEETLYSSRGLAKPQGNAFGRFAMHIRQLP